MTYMFPEAETIAIIPHNTAWPTFLLESLQLIISLNVEL